MRADPRPLEPLAAGLRLGERSPVALVEACADRIDAVEDDVHALVPEPGRRTRLRREAAALEAAHDAAAARPPLFGVPVGVKDVFHVDGFRTRAGSTLPPAALGGDQATAVTRLLDAGAIHLGKTHTTELAYFAPGPTRNPHALDHTPGGSSSGSAAAVAAGLCPLALGTQTVGSVLRPAAFCGVVGFKPSGGRIPLDGVVPFAPTVDHVGTFTADVAGAARAARVLCDGWEPVDPDARPVLGVVEGPYLEQAAPAGRAALEAGVETLAAAGYEARRLSIFDDVEAVNDRHERLIAAELALSHATRYEAYGDRFAESTAELVETGHGVGVEELVEARLSTRALGTRVEERMQEAGVDLLLSPAAPGPAPAGIDDTGDPVMNLPWTHASLPALAVPCGRVGARPLGLQLVAPVGDDESLLAWARTVASTVAGVGSVGDADA
jgi:Asp-tRNA(Asn)/Glu-tRNA(Gln) amidotransferase A subunit family amidase